MLTILIALILAVLPLAQAENGTKVWCTGTEAEAKLLFENKDPSRIGLTSANGTKYLYKHLAMNKACSQPAILEMALWRPGGKSGYDEIQCTIVGDPSDPRPIIWVRTEPPWLEFDGKYQGSLRADCQARTWKSSFNITLQNETIGYLPFNLKKHPDDPFYDQSEGKTRIIWGKKTLTMKDFESSVNRTDKADFAVATRKYTNGPWNLKSFYSYEGSLDPAGPYELRLSQVDNGTDVVKTDIGRKGFSFRANERTDLAECKSGGLNKVKVFTPDKALTFVMIGGMPLYNNEGKNRKTDYVRLWEMASSVSATIGCGATMGLIIDYEIWGDAKEDDWPASNAKKWTKPEGTKPTFGMRCVVHGASEVSLQMWLLTEPPYWQLAPDSFGAAVAGLSVDCSNTTALPEPKKKD